MFHLLKITLILISVVALCASPAHRVLHAQEVVAVAQRDARYYQQQAVKAYKEKNYAGYLENMKQAVRLRPDQPTYLYNLAGAYALAGNKAEALATLRRVAEMSLIYPAERDTDFDAVKDTPEFQEILKRFAANKSPVGQSSTAFTIQQRGLVIEGVAYDPSDESFYLSSVRERKILKVSAERRVSDFATEVDGLWSAMGMKVDARRRHLWVATAAVKQMTNFRREEEGQSGVLKFDLRTGKLIKKYTVGNRAQAHWLGDLVVNERGDVFVTDSLTPALYVLRAGASELVPLLEGAPFVSPQGLDFSPDGKKLFIADYSKGIFVYDVESGKTEALAAPPASTLIGIDGLYFYKNSLIAIQNGTRPHRVVRIFLSRDLRSATRVEVVEANNALFDEPTLGVLIKESFYYIANSQWGTVDKDGNLAPTEKLRDTIVLKTKL